MIIIKKQKKKIIKGMTLRYSVEQEAKIKRLMTLINEKTMSKTLLNAPQIVIDQLQMISELREENKELNIKIRQLSSVVNSWDIFTRKAGDYLKGLTGD